jgi:hypothetical protein
VYSLCATVHFILLKKPPPPSVGRAVSDSYEPLTQALAGHYSPRLLAAIDKGLSFKPAERFQSMGELRAALGFARGAESTTVSKAGTKNLQPSLQSPSGVPVGPQLGVEGSGQRPASELRSGRHALSGLLTVGQVIGGRLEVSATIRLGTALEWYRGHEIETGAEVLIATVSPRLACDSALLDKMEAQAKLWKALAVVPGIVPLLEVIRSESGMTYIFRAPAGASVRQLLVDRQAEGRLFSASEATRMVASLAVPLARVHEQTACLLLTPDVIWSDGKGGYAVAGTGLEMALGREGLCQLVVQEGLQAYLAPELTQRRSSAAGRREQLPNADQYSLAVIVYEMVSGAVPEAGTYAVPLDKVDAQASAAALKLKPQARFPSVEEFAQALAATMTPTRRRTVWAFSATLAFALVSGSAWMGWHYFQARTLEQSALNARAALQSELQSLDATQSEWANESASLDQRVKLLEAQAKASPEEANDAYGLGRSVARAKREGVAILDGRKLFEALVVSSADVRESRQALEAGQGSWGLGKRQEALDTWSSALLAAKEANKNAEQIKVTMQLLAQAAGRVADFEALARDVDSVDLDRARAELSRASQALSSGQFGQARELALATSSRLEADVARELPKVRAKWGRQAEAMPLGPEFDELVRRGRNLCGWAENVCK